ncbi:MAG: hypothetical protein FJY82_02320 [Candidatus Aminicenantes bacterium]|nr:hypothetical protein [Candidatus Aminicenantes bacterium]
MLRAAGRRNVLPAVAAAVGLLFPAVSGRAEEKPRPAPTYLGLSLAVRHVSDEVFEEVYGPSGTILGLTASQGFFGAQNFELSAVIDIRRMRRDGLSTVSGVETRFGLTPLSLGLEGALVRGVAVLWLGLGGDLAFYREESGLGTTSGSTLGFHIAGGLALHPWKTVPVRFKLFLRWTKAGTTENGIPAELGGPEYGLGVLYGFRLL